MISPTLIYGPTARQVARAVIGAGAYQIRQVSSAEDFFVWKSGIRAPVYCDCRVLNGDPGAVALIKRALGSSIRSNFPHAEYVVGVAEAGIVWSTLASVDVGLPHSFVRKQPKKHGPSANQEAYVECNPPERVRAVLVDDLVASGGSLEKAIERLMEERQIETIGVQSIVNWDFLAMRRRFRHLQVPIRALVSFPHLLEAGREVGLLTEEARAELATFYRAPGEHVWNLSALAPTAALAS